MSSRLWEFFGDHFGLTFLGMITLCVALAIPLVLWVESWKEERTNRQLAAFHALGFRCVHTLSGKELRFSGSDTDYRPGLVIGTRVLRGRTHEGKLFSIRDDGDWTCEEAAR